jgi:hypothetical protein
MRKHALLIPVLGNSSHSEQLIRLMKTVKSKGRANLTAEHLKKYLQVKVPEIKPDIESLLKQKQCQIS